MEPATKGKSPGIKRDNYAQTTSSLEIWGWDLGAKCQLEKTPPHFGVGTVALETPSLRQARRRILVLESPHRPEKRRCICGSSGYREIWQGRCASSLPTVQEPRARRATEGRHRLWAPRDPPANALRRQRPRTPGSRHQLKAVKVNEDGRGAWHHSIPTHKGRFWKSRESPSRRTPAGAFRQGALTSDLPSGPRLPRRRLEPKPGGRRPGESPRAGPRPPNPPRAAQPPPASGRGDAVSGASSAPTSRSARTPGPPPPPGNSGAARQLTRSPKPAARRACPVHLGERACERAPRGREPLRSPGLGGSRSAEHLVDRSAGGELASGAGWAGDGR